MIALLALSGAVLGAIIGSFLGALCVRWPVGGSVMRGRSRCDGCGQQLPVRHLVPLLSSLILRGRAACCGVRIDPVHAVMEIGCALIGLFCFALLSPLPALFFAAGGWLLLTLAVLDARHFWLPDALTLPFAVLGLTLGEWMLPASFEDRLIGAGIGYLGLFALAIGYRSLRGREGLGLGDAKLLGGIGAWLGWQALPLVLLIASSGGLLWALIMRLRGQPLVADMRLPLGTMMCAAFVPAGMGALALGLWRMAG